MLFWIAVAVLTLLASLTVLLPLTREGEASARPSRPDLAVYRDQLAEVDRDVSRGLIDPAEAEQARAEIGRRILKLNVTADASRRTVDRGARALGVAAVLLVPALSWGLYGALGSPDMPSQPLEARLSKLPSESSADELVARAERALRENPGDGRGWDALAPVYQRLGRANESVFAYRNAIKLLGDTAQRSAGLGVALSDQAGGTVSADAKAMFEHALALDPDEPKARFFLGVASAQERRYEEAIAAWTALATSLPPDSEWRSTAEGAVTAARQKMTENVAGPATGPTAEDMAAADKLSAGERGEMIEAMVASLDEKLKTRPDDAEGWKRLVRSYVVLGKADAARDALVRGRKALSDPAKQDDLVRFAGSLGLSVTE